MTHRLIRKLSRGLSYIRHGSLYLTSNSQPTYVNKSTREKKNTNLALLSTQLYYHTTMHIKVLITFVSAAAAAVLSKYSMPPGSVPSNMISNGLPLDQQYQDGLSQEQDNEAVIFGCYWDGTAPYCAGSCQGPRWEQRGRSNCGNGSCCWTGSKALCCESRGWKK